MGFDRPLPTPVYGVSTIEPAARPEGFCSEQINWRNDVQRKLTTRPKTMAKSAKLPASQISPDCTTTKVVLKDGKRQEIVVNGNTSTGLLEVYYRQDYEEFIRRELDVSTWFSNGGDLGANLIDSEFYIWNRKQVIDVEKKPDLPLSKTKLVSLLNVTSALNYAEEVVIELTAAQAQETVTYAVPGLTSENQEAADTARATNVVASGIADSINLLTNFSAMVQGSNVYVTTDNFLASSMNIKVSSGRGDSTIVAFNYTLASIDFLPKYSPAGVVREVAPDPSTDNGRFYLSAVPVDENDTTAMPEVVWTETFDPEDSYAFNADSFVVRLRSDSVLEKFTFEEQLVGNSDSNKALDFVGKAIEYLEFFQDRLTVLAGNRITVSKTDELNMFWKGSALETLVTDPTSVGTSGNSSTLRKAVFHNRDLLIFADDGQFKLDGSVPLTPQTAALPRTTSNESSLRADPVQMGAYVYYANNYGSSGGVRRFEVQADTSVDTSVSITDHIIGYMAGEIIQLVSNANQNMLIVRSSLSKPNEFFVFEQQRAGDQVINSWCTWELAEGMVINHIDLFNETITIRHNEQHYVTCNLKTDELYPVRDISLDQAVPVTIENNLVKIPDHWRLDVDAGVTIVLSDNTRRDVLAVLEGTYIETANGVHVFDIFENLDGKECYVGYKYTPLYEPTRPYERDRAGNIRTTDRLRINAYVLELSNTYSICRSVLSEWWNLEDQEFTSLNAATTEFIDEVKPYTGQWRAQIGMNAADCEVQFKVTKPYAATIVAMSYQGQQYSTRSRR